MRRTVSLRRRVVGLGALVVAVVVAALSVAVYVGVRARLYDNVDALLDDRERLARELAGTVDAQTLANQLSSSAVGVEVDARDGRGRPVSLPAVVPEHVVPGPRPSPRAGEEARARRRVVDLGGAGTIVLSVSTAGVDDALRRLAAIEAVAGLAGIGSAVVLLDRAARRALRPLDDVVDTATRIAGGDLSERLAPDRVDTELGRMAVAFDGMLDALDGALERSRAAEGRSRRFLADAAHQLRTPIAGVQASVEALPLAPDAATRDRLGANLMVEAERLGRLVAALLHIARLDALPDRSPCDLPALCRAELDRLAARRPNLGVEYRGPATATVAVVVDGVREALANLVDNAGRHARGRVVLSLAVEDATVSIEVADDGPGVPPGQAEEIFERFVTLDGGGGAGLGLAVVRAVAEAHGGSVAYTGGKFQLVLRVG